MENRDGKTFPYAQGTDETTAREMWMASAARTAVAVDAAETVLGTATMGTNHDGPGAHAASASFMVDPGRWGEGADRALVEPALDRARDQGLRVMQFNAVAESTDVPSRCTNHSVRDPRDDPRGLPPPRPGLRRPARHASPALNAADQRGDQGVRERASCAPSTTMSRRSLKNATRSVTSPASRSGVG